MSFKLQVNLSFQYSGQGYLSEPPPAKDKILLRIRELQATSFDPAPCGEKNTAALKALAALISPFMTLTTRSPVPNPRTVTDLTATNQQLSGKDGPHSPNR
jgi:hypothetical protein